MKREQEFAAAIDRRLSPLSASEARRSRIQTYVYAQEQEEHTVKHFSRAMAFALVAALLLAAVAVAESLNLFDLFGRRDARYAAVAPQTTLTFTEAAVVHDPELGTAVASIDNAYFDGLSLSLAYRISHGQIVEEYTPTAEELNTMQKDSSLILCAAYSQDDPGRDILLAWNRALETGTPYGYRQISITTSDHTTTDDGIDIAPDSSYPLYNENGDFCDMREYECPLPAAVRDREALRVDIAIYQTELRLWFDGSDCYWSSVSSRVGTMSAVIPKNGESRHLTGQGTINGVVCSVSAEVSPMAAVVTLQSDAPFNQFLAQPPEGTDKGDCWISMSAVDQNGTALRPRNGWPFDDSGACAIILDGTGAMPETLSVSLFSEWEDGNAPAPADQIILTAK